MPAGTPAQVDPPAAPAAAWRPPARRRIVTIGVLLVAALALLLVLAAWDLFPFNGARQTTENAYVRGRTTVIAPQVSGYVVEVAVRDYEQVEAGQALVRIDDRIYRARLAQAQANLDAQLAALENNQQAQAARNAALAAQPAALANAQAQQVRAEADMRRAQELARDGSLSVRELDLAVAALRQAQALVGQSESAIEIARQEVRTVQVGRDALQAQVEAARAQLRLAQIDLDNTVIAAPEAGKLGEIGVRRGQYVTNGTQLLALVPADRWVIANFKEGQTARMRPGQHARIKVDALDGAVLRGHVEGLSPAAGSEFAVFKPDNATGNFVKVPQRIGVRILLDAQQPLLQRLSPGMSVEARVDTASGP